MSERWFLALDGIVGESTDERHPDEIEVASWSIGVTRSRSTTAGGGGAGRADLQELQIAAPLSSASPQIFRLATTGAHLPKARLSGIRQGTHAHDFLTIELSEASVTRCRLGDDPESSALDEFSLDYSRITVTYRGQAADGSLSPPVTASFDITHGTVT